MKKYAILKSVKAILPGKENPVETDILINQDSGIIEKIQGGMDIDGVPAITRYNGLTVMPGFIDPHVHFRIPGKSEAEDWKHGSLAALSGGVTTVLDMPNNNPAITDEKSLELKINLVEKDSLINYGIFGGLTANNLEFLIKEKNIKAIKVYLASTTGDMLIDNIHQFDFSGTGKVICFHAEDEAIIQNNAKIIGELIKPVLHSQIRSEEAAITSTHKIMALYEKTKGNFHIAHVSTAEEIQLLNQSSISFECAPHHIFCNTENYNRGGFFWKCNPPLRSPDTQNQIRNLLYQEKIPMIATDHAPHTILDKSFQKNSGDGKPAKIPASGIPSIEVGTHFILNEVSTGKILLNYASGILSSNAARRFHIEKRGLIQEGYFADLAIVDFNKPWVFQKENILSKCGWSPFTGFEFKAKVIATFVNGHEFVIENLKHNLNVEIKNQIYKV